MFDFVQDVFTTLAFSAVIYASLEGTTLSPQKHKLTKRRWNWMAARVRAWRKNRSRYAVLAFD